MKKRWMAILLHKKYKVQNGFCWSEKEKDRANVIAYLKQFSQ